MAREVRRDRDEALSLGAASTPSFIIGDTPLVGAQPLAEFVKAIDAAKAARG